LRAQNAIHNWRSQAEKWVTPPRRGEDSDALPALSPTGRERPFMKHRKKSVVIRAGFD